MNEETPENALLPRCLLYVYDAVLIDDDSAMQNAYPDRANRFEKGS